MPSGKAEIEGLMSDLERLIERAASLGLNTASYLLKMTLLELRLADCGDDEARAILAGNAPIPVKFRFQRSAMRRRR
jgi:hypothetical protein